MTDEKNFQQFKASCKQRYQALNDVYCPVLMARVNFGSDGWYHMLFKTSREKRNVTEQCSRLILIPLIKPVLLNAKVIDETRIEKSKNLRGDKIDAYYALVANVGKRPARVKVVVRKSSNGMFHFHSVMKLKTKSTS